MSMKDVLNPYFTNRKSNYTFNPNDIIYVPSLEFKFGDAIMNPLGSTAYRTKTELLKSDKWKNNPNLKIKQMTVKDFLKRRLNNYNSTNEFSRLKEFAEKYEEIHKVKIGVRNDE